MKRDLIFFIDRSLSVYGHKSSILSFYQRALKSYVNDALLITICLFSDSGEVLCFRQPPHIASSILKKEYYNDGSSAIFDSLCSFIDEWNQYIYRTSAKESKTHLFIVTDKKDNGSIAKTYADVVKEVNAKLMHNWELKLYDMQLNEFQMEDLNTKGERHGNQR